MKVKPSLQIVTAGLLLASGVIVLTQWSGLSKLRRENHSLREVTVEIEKLRAEGEALKETVKARERDLENVRADKGELLKLRGEMSAVRGQTKELESLRAEVQRLRAELSAQAASSETAAEKERFVQKQWEAIEADDQLAAAFALRAIPLLESGEDQKAMELLARPIGTFYRVYKTRATTVERSNFLARIEEAARRHPVIDRELRRTSQ